MEERGLTRETAQRHMLMTDVELRIAKRMENDLLEMNRKEQAIPRICFGLIKLPMMIKSVIFVSMVYNIFMAIGNRSLVNLLFATCSSVGLVGVMLPSKTLMLVYGAYLMISFVSSSVLAVGAFQVLANEELCDVIERIAGPELGEFCRSAPMRFSSLASAVMMLQLLFDVYFMVQMRRLYKYYMSERSLKITSFS